MLAYYTKKIAEEGFIGFVCTNAVARVAPWGGAERVFGTNPLSYAFPVDDEPIVFDIATSATAGFKLRLASLRGERIPEGMALDKDGNPTTDPKKSVPRRNTSSFWRS
jgi:LDH2 family malate/lactate/ureidoglycolate dehydrogenase